MSPTGVPYTGVRRYSRSQKGGVVMSRKPYVAPRVFDLGKVRELTRTTAEEDKCSGSGDVRTVQQISPNYSTDCP
jgi:hypothetical protein